MSSLVALFEVSWYGVKIWFTIYKGYGSVMSIKDLIKELDSNLIVDDIEKKKIADLVKMMYEAAIEWERRGYVGCSRLHLQRECQVSSDITNIYT